MKIIVVFLAFSLHGVLAVDPPFNLMVTSASNMNRIETACTDAGAEAWMDLSLEDCPYLQTYTDLQEVWTNAKGGDLGRKPKSYYYYNFGRGQPVLDAAGDRVRRSGKNNCLALNVQTCTFVTKRCRKSTTDGLCFAPVSLMVAGGDSAQNKVEVVSLTGLPLKTCAPITDILLNFQMVGTYINDQALVCSGKNDETSCYTYDTGAQTWNAGASLTVPDKSNRGSVQLSPTIWVIAGGFQRMAGQYDGIEVYDSATGMFTSLATPLPRGTRKPLLIPIDDHTLVFIGGGLDPTTRDAHLIDIDAATVTPLPDLLSDRIFPQGGLVSLPGGRKRLVVAGDINGDLTTNIYDFETETWTLGPNDLPFAVGRGTSVQYKNTFLIVGGEDDSGENLDTILEFDPKKLDWIERAETLVSPKSNNAAFLVPNDYVSCT